MTENNDLSTTQITPEEQKDQELFKAVYKANLNSKDKDSKVKVLFVDKDTGEVKAPATIDGAQEQDNKAPTTDSGGKSKEKVEGTAEVPKDGTEVRDESETTNTTKAKAQPKPKESKDGKSKKPSVLDEVSQLQAGLEDANTKASVGSLVDYARELEKQVNDLSHKIKSDDGRVSAYQRQADELRRQLAYHQAQPSKDTDKAAPKTAPKANEDEVMDFIKSEPELKQLYESDPGLAKFLAEREVLRDKKLEQKDVQNAEKTEKQRRSSEDQERYLKTQGEIISREIPNIAQVLDHPWWKQWVSTSPQLIQQAVVSPHAHEFLEAYKLFERDVEIYLQQNPHLREGHVEEEEEPVAAPKAKAEVVDTTEADRIKAARDKRVKANTGASSAAATPKVVEIDEKEVFKQAYNSVPQWKR